MRFTYRLDEAGIDEFLGVLKKRLNKLSILVFGCGCILITIYGILATTRRNVSSTSVALIWGIIAIGYVGFYIAKNIGVNRALKRQKEVLMNQIKVTYHVDAKDFEAELTDDKIIINAPERKRDYLLSDVSHYIVAENNIFIFFKDSIAIYALKSSMESPAEFEKILSQHAPKDKPAKK